MKKDGLSAPKFIVDMYKNKMVEVIVPPSFFIRRKTLNSSRLFANATIIAAMVILRQSVKHTHSDILFSFNFDHRCIPANDAGNLAIDPCIRPASASAARGGWKKGSEAELNQQWWRGRQRRAVVKDPVT